MKLIIDAASGSFLLGESTISMINKLERERERGREILQDSDECFMQHICLKHSCAAQVRSSGSSSLVYLYEIDGKIASTTIAVFII